MNLLQLFNDSDDVVSIAGGTTIFNADDPGDRAYVVLAGEVDIKIRDQVVETAKPGDLVGEMALIDSAPRSAGAAARTDCQLVPLDQKRFLYLVQETPFFSVHVMRVLVERLRRMNTKL